jgi:hypothetical protein
MPAQYLHIVSFNIPYPADYGGVIDIFYKIKSLSQAGIRVILHCFQYGRQHSKELEDLCFKVHYYHRDHGLKYLLQADPYVVVTRYSNIMPKNLLGDSFPVLFEGLHTTAALGLCKEAGKKVLVRAHNIEHSYYRGLAGSTKNLPQKLFFRWEASKLLKYEKIIGRADHILSIARHEAAYFKQKYGNSIFLPAFHRFDEMSSRPGSGNYILYHGNLSVSENSEVILDLARGVLGRLPLQVVVAGKNPSMAFRKKIARFPNIRLVADPDDRELEDLIVQAHINLLYTRQATGIKLKLLHSLFAGRHCLANPALLEGSGLEKLCTVAGSERELERQIHDLMQLPFEESELRRRRKALKDYSNRANAEKILRLLT